MTRFWIFSEGEAFLSPEIDGDEPIPVLLESLLKYPFTPKSLVPHLAECTLYKFGTPLLIRAIKEDPAKACLGACGDWIKIGNLELVEDLASDEYLSKKYVCLIIETPNGQHEKAINNLTNYYEALFKSLQIRLENIRSWSRNDVVNNLNGGVFLSNGERRTEPAITDVENALAEHRTFVMSDASATYSEDLALARKYGSPEFEQYFEEHFRATRQSDSVQNSREFVAYHSLFRCHNPDSERVSKDPSSHFKANQLSSYFLMPPFFSCRTEESKTIFKTELPWKFPVFIATQAEKSNWCKYIPCSDFSVCVENFLCPFLICEVICDPQESDRYRMLVQGIAAVRAVNVLKKSGSNKNLFVVAVYLRANLTAERYIIMQTPSQKTSSRKTSLDPPKVSISQTNYDLLASGEALAFLKDMFNLQDKMDELVGELDNQHLNALSTIANLAGPITSLTQQRTATKGMQGTKQSGMLDSIPEDAQPGGQRRAGQSLFTDDSEIQERLTEMGYRVEMSLHGFDNVAMISRESDAFERGFLKFTRQEHEVVISQYLVNLISPENHTIPGLQVWTLRSGGFIIYSTSGGSHLVDLNAPDVHMWSTAKQFVEGVAFMHKHGVAHLDIKPANVLIHPDGGRLSIIDFGISEFVTPGRKLRGTRGTDDYMAPEVIVENSYYDPIRADLWSSGKTLEELTLRCRRSTTEKEFLVSIARQLMADDPLERPTMSEVLDWMTDFESSPSVERPRMRFPFSRVASGIRA